MIYFILLFAFLCGCSAAPRTFSSVDLDSDVVKDSVVFIDSRDDTVPADTRVSREDTAPKADTREDTAPSTEADTRQPIQFGTLIPVMLDMNDLDEWSFTSVNGSAPLSTPEWNGGSGEFSWTSPAYTANRSFNFTFVVNGSLPCQVWLTVDGVDTDHQTSSEKKMLAFYVPIYRAGSVRITIHMKSASSCFYQAHGWS
jgi:hypothetical protein